MVSFDDLKKQDLPNLWKAIVDSDSKKGMNLLEYYLDMKNNNNTAGISFIRNLLSWMSEKGIRIDDEHKLNFKYKGGREGEIFKRRGREKGTHEYSARCLCGQGVAYPYRISVSAKSPEEKIRAISSPLNKGPASLGERTVGPEHYNMLLEISQRLGDEDFVERNAEKSLYKYKKRKESELENRVKRLGEEEQDDDDFLNAVKELLDFGQDAFSKNLDVEEWFRDHNGDMSNVNFIKRNLDYLSEEDKEVCERVFDQRLDMEEEDALKFGKILCDLKPVDKNTLLGGIIKDIKYFLGNNDSDIIDYVESNGLKPFYNIRSRLSSFVSFKHPTSGKHDFILREAADSLLPVRIPLEEILLNDEYETVTFAEAAGIRNYLPGFEKARENINRNFGEMYFSDFRKFYKNIKGLKDIIEKENEIVQKITVLRKKGEESKADSLEDELLYKAHERQNALKAMDVGEEGEKGLWRNLNQLVSIANSRNIYRNLRVVCAKRNLSAKYDVGKSNSYIPTKDFEVDYDNVGEKLDDILILDEKDVKNYKGLLNLGKRERDFLRNKTDYVKDCLQEDVIDKKNMNMLDKIHEWLDNMDEDGNVSQDERVLATKLLMMKEKGIAKINRITSEGIKRLSRYRFIEDIVANEYRDDLDKFESIATNDYKNILDKDVPLDVAESSIIERKRIIDEYNTYIGKRFYDFQGEIVSPFDVGRAVNKTNDDSVKIYRYNEISEKLKKINNYFNDKNTFNSDDDKGKEFIECVSRLDKLIKTYGERDKDDFSTLLPSGSKIGRMENIYLSSIHDDIKNENKFYATNEVYEYVKNVLKENLSWNRNIEQSNLDDLINASENDSIRVLISPTKDIKDNIRFSYNVGGKKQEADFTFDKERGVYVSEMLSPSDANSILVKLNENSERKRKVVYEKC
ncbi:MAG: hypothetical protein ACQER9_02630 [Nanobdellota archaeon]